MNYIILVTDSIMQNSNRILWHSTSQIKKKKKTAIAPPRAAHTPCMSKHTIIHLLVTIFSSLYSTNIHLLLCHYYQTKEKPMAFFWISFVLSCRKGQVAIIHHSGLYSQGQLRVHLWAQIYRTPVCEYNNASGCWGSTACNDLIQLQKSLQVIQQEVQRNNNSSLLKKPFGVSCWSWGFRPNKFQKEKHMQ